MYSAPAAMPPQYNVLLLQNNCFAIAPSISQHTDRKVWLILNRETHAFADIRIGARVSLFHVWDGF